MLAGDRMDLGGGGRRGDVKEENKKEIFSHWIATRICSIKKDLRGGWVAQSV